ncbi:hypothetical protein [Owenweeksia hongkongensis]|uniref:hypothetical protein n=1 Tax=Owenweeksia hongkongensis TaxID=253245 RepID=UPI003A91E99E
MQNKILTFWNKNERYLFWVLLLVNLIPVLGVEYFFTGDGPAHLYNSNIIASLLSDPNSPYQDFFALRYELIPNLGGHLLLTLFNAWLPAAIAEKLVCVLYLILFPISFRYAVKQFGGTFNPLLYLIFPLAHNFCFYIGFQSFSLSLAFMFFTIGLAHRAYIKGTWISALAWGMMLFITALFHLFPAMVAMMALGIYFLIQLIQERFKNIKTVLPFVVLGLPSVIFCLQFILGNSESFQFNQTELHQQLKGIYLALPIVTIDGKETYYSVMYNVIFALSLIAVFAYRLRKKRSFQLIDFLFITGLLLLALYFILPDSMATGGFLSLRFSLCFFLAWGFWLVLNAKTNIITLILGLAFIAVNLYKLPYQLGKAKELEEDAQQIMEAEAYIPEGSTVLPLNYSYHWLHYHIGLYLAADKNLVVLDNYEAYAVHFPVKWKEETWPQNSLGDFGKSHRPKVEISAYEEYSGKTVDCVVRYGHSYDMDDASTLYTDSLLAVEFYPAFTSDDKMVEVHLRKGLSKE